MKRFKKFLKFWREENEPSLIFVSWTLICVIIGIVAPEYEYGIAVWSAGVCLFGPFIIMFGD